MPDNTCIKFLIADASWDGVREHLHSFGSLFQVFIPRDSPNVVYARYKHASSATNAKRALGGDERVISVEMMEEWPFEKKQKPKSNANTSSDSGECSEANFPLRKPLECHKCCGYAELMCSVCGAWYCSEQCQLLDWHEHTKTCIPRLIRGFPSLTSLQNLAMKNTQQLLAQQQKSKQTQQAQQQPAQQTQQKNQQQAKQPQQKQQQQKPAQQTQPKDEQQQQERAQQNLMNEQLRKEKESGLNLEKRFSPNGANQTEQAKRQPDCPMEQARANGVLQKAKDDHNKKKPNTSENPGKANDHYIPADKLDANLGKSAPQEKKPERSQLKEQQNNTKQAAQSVLPNKLDDQTLKKQPSQAAVATDVALNGPKRATQGLVKSEQPGDPTSAPKGADDPPKAPQGPSFLQKRMKALAAAKRTIAYNAFPAVGSTVSVSVVTENTLYIHEITDDAVNDPFMRFVTRCILHASEIKQQLQHPPAVGDIVFAPFENNYYRAIVKKCEGDSSFVFFPDFGNSQPIHWKLLKEIRDADIKYATCMTHAASLFVDGPFSPAVQNFLSDLIEVQRFEVTRVEANPTAGVRKVELRHLQAKYILSAKIRELTANDLAALAKQAAPAEKKVKLVAPDPATYKPVYSTEFKESCIPNDGSKEEELIVVEASQFTNTQAVSIILASKQRPFAAVLKECDEYGRLDPNEYLGEPERNYACLVRYDNTWSRAMKIDNDDQYYLVDFGIMRGLDQIDAVRRFPPALSRELFCAEYMVDNPEMLMKLWKESDYSTDALRGRFVKAKLRLDRETELIHMKIVSISA